MNKKKYTKCQCCPFYGLNQSSKKWRCGRSYCSFDFTGADIIEVNERTINRWINANKGEQINE